VVQNRWLSSAIVTLVFGLLLGLYLYNITGWLKEDDEGTALYVTWRFAEGEIPYQDLTTTKGPFFLLLGAGFNRLFGPSILGLRAATALALIGGGFFWFCGLRSVYGLTAGLIGAVVFLLIPEVYQLGRVFRADSWMLALTACGLSAFLAGLHSRRRPWFILSGGLFGMAVLTKVLVVMPLLGCSFFLLVRLLLNRRWREEVLDIALFAASFLIIAVVGFGLVEMVVPGAMGMILGSHGGHAENVPSWAFRVGRALLLYVWFIASNCVTILAIPFARQALSLRGRVTIGLCFLCQLLSASAILILRGDVYPRYLAYTALGFSGLFAMGIGSILARAGNRLRYAAVMVLVLLVAILSLFQLRWLLLRSEAGTMALVDYIVENTEPDDVILSDYAELAFHARRRSVPQTGGIGQGWAVAGLITGEELIQAIERYQVSLVALHVPGGPEAPGHLYYLQDWDMFYRYVQEHFQFETQMLRAGQLFEIYTRSTGE
jgi:4-amino-4-deoxy-L-arabinose transferase-like glycosyltransferase